jgi:hypothetical protein
MTAAAVIERRAYPGACTACPLRRLRARLDEAIHAFSGRNGSRRATGTGARVR